MTTYGLLSQIKTIEMQLAMLKAQVKNLNLPAPTQTMGDLYGVLAGKANSTDSDIDAALYRFDWEEEIEGTPE